MKLQKSSEIFSLQSLYKLSVIVLSICLLVILYFSSYYIFSIGAFLLFILLSLSYSTNKLIKYLLAYASLLILVIVLNFANISFGRLTMFVYLIPLIYGLILKDLFTPGIAGLSIIWLFHTYIGHMEFQIIKSSIIVMIIASIGYTVVIYLFQRLSRELCYKDIISKISSRFAGVTDIEKEIKGALKDMGQASGVSRSYIFEFREGGRIMDNTYEWCAPGVEPQINNLKNRPVNEVSWWNQTLLEDGLIHIKDVSKMPPEAGNEKKSLEKQGIKSLLAIPLKMDKELIGFIGFDDVVKVGKWKKEDINLLKLSSEILANVLYRKEVKHKLHKTLESLEREVEIRTQNLSERKTEYKRVIESIPQAIYIVDGEDITFCNKAGGELLGMSDFRELIGKKIWDFIPESCDEIMENLLYQVLVEGKEISSLEGNYEVMPGKVIHAEVNMMPIPIEKSLQL